jgi:hypothetical protein
MHGDMTLLVKGSRVMRMERVVAGIARQAQPAVEAGHGVA